MKLNICMILSLRYRPDMRVPPQIEICTYLRNFGHNITLIMWGEGNKQVQSFSYDTVHVYTTPEPQYLTDNSPLASILNMMPNTLRRMRIIAKILKKEKYDLILVRDYAFDGLVAAYIGRKYKIPFVFQLSNPLEQYWEDYKINSPKLMLLFYLFAKFHQFIATRLLHEADLILPISKWLKEHLVRQGVPESKILPCPSGVDTEFFFNQDGGNIRNKYHLNGYNTIIYVGVLGKARGLDVLIQAFSVVMKKKKVKLIMVGEGNDEDYLKQLANELNVQDNIIFTGRVIHKEIPDYIASADIGVSPVAPLYFFKLSSPIKLLEYMSMAKPVIANEEIYEQREILEESGAGILIPFTPEALAEAMIKLLDNPELAAEMGQRGKEWVVKNRSYEILARPIEQGYFKLLEGKENHD